MTDQADFSKLPGDALGFFGLSDPFQRDDLRRAYGRLIRQYKPDTAPREFQKIRAAYEQLDAELRYGELHPSVAAGSWLAATGQGVPSPSPSAPSLRPSAVVERLQVESPESIYRELGRRSDKTASDYYVLAVLSDTVASDDSLLFLKWLLNGLKQDCRDPALLMLLREYLRTEVETTRLPAILAAVSKVVTNDRFYFITEPAWDRLLRESPFAVFRQALSGSEANLHDYQINAKLAFYIHVLLPAVWKGDADWISTAFAFVEENASEIGGQAEHDLELATLAHATARLAGEFLNGNAVRTTMIESLRNFCTAAPMQGMQAVIRGQAAIASDSLEVMAAFPLNDNKDWSEIVRFWHMVTNLVTEEVGIESIGNDPARLERPTLLLIKNLREELIPVVVRYHRFRRNVLGVWLAGLSLLPLVGLGFLPVIGVVFLQLCSIFGSVAAYRLYFKDQWLDPWFEKQLVRRLERAYAQAWRPRLFRHQYAVRVAREDMLSQLYQSASETGDANWIGWIINMLLADAGFGIYSLAQRFLR